MDEERPKLNSERKKKSFSMKKKDSKGRPIATSNSATTTLKLDGFQLMPSSGRKI